jgi:hypothetical protein
MYKNKSEKPTDEDLPLSHVEESKPRALAVASVGQA